MHFEQKFLHFGLKMTFFDFFDVKYHQYIKDTHYRLFHTCPFS